MTLLKLTGITKSFGAVDVLHGVDLAVAAGDWWETMAPANQR